MAITTTTITKNIGWARTDVIYQLEEAFTWLGFHGETKTGIVTGISTYSGGGSGTGIYNSVYYDVFPVTTTGIGTGASFNVNRGNSNGSVNRITVNRPGYGYTSGEYVTLSAANIGGTANGAVAIGITVLVDGGASPVGYGTTTAFYDKDVTAGSSYPWGVLRHTIQPNKKFGDTYRGFQMTSDTNLVFHVGSGFHPSNNNNTYNDDKTHGYPNRFAGNELLDIPYSPHQNAYFKINQSFYYGNFYHGESYNSVASSNSYRLDLNVYRSGIDPKFAVLSFKQPTLSSLILTDNTFTTFILHNYISTIWDYDNLFLSGLTYINVNSNNYPTLRFKTFISGESEDSNYNPSKRAAEFGYAGSQSNNYADKSKVDEYASLSFPQTTNTYYNTIYMRNQSRNTGGYNSLDILPEASNFNSVIKGIPICSKLVPCPYYIPDDFVLIDFDYGSPSANIQQGDTVTISGSEVYTVITGAYNQTTRTRGILFCARTT
jgi:hypothetical protein